MLKKIKFYGLLSAGIISSAICYKLVKNEQASPMKEIGTVIKSEKDLKNYKNEIFKQNRNNIDNMDENRSNIEESMEKPSFLNNNSIDNVNKSQEILQQINSYLDNEKKNLN